MACHRLVVRVELVNLLRRCCCAGFGVGDEGVVHRAAHLSFQTAKSLSVGITVSDASAVVLFAAATVSDLNHGDGMQSAIELAVTGPCSANMNGCSA